MDVCYYSYYFQHRPLVDSTVLFFQSDTFSGNQFHLVCLMYAWNPKQLDINGGFRISKLFVL